MNASVRSPDLVAPPVPTGEPDPRLAAWREGNTGVEHVFRLRSSRPGPHLMLNCLTHGDEPAGVGPLVALLERGFRPARGTLTISFANVAAHTNGPRRYLDRDLNRVWSDALLDTPDSAREVVRARALRPLLDGVDYLVDLHSTAFTSTPFFVLPRLARAARFARSLARFGGVPGRQLLLGEAALEGPHLIQYGAFAEPRAPAAAVIVECGTHFSAAAEACAARVCAAALATLGMANPAGDDPRREPPPGERYEVVGPCVARSHDFVLDVPYEGFVAARRGQLVAFDGERPVHAPDDLVVLPPRALRGAGIAFNWGRRID